MYLTNFVMDSGWGWRRRLVWFMENDVKCVATDWQKPLISFVNCVGRVLLLRNADGFPLISIFHAANRWDQTVLHKFMTRMCCICTHEAIVNIRCAAHTHARNHEYESFSCVDWQSKWKTKSSNGAHNSQREASAFDVNYAKNRKKKYE